MVKEFLARLETEVLIGFLTQTILTDWGFDLLGNLTEWIVSHPNRYQEALKAMYAAGCDIAFIGTQSANPFRLETFGLQDDVYELNYKAAELAKAVTPHGHYVCGVISSSNPRFLEPVGDLTTEEVREGYKKQIIALQEGGADLLSIGGNQLEASVIAIRVAKENCHLPVLSNNVFYLGKKGFRTIMGNDPVVGSARLQEAGADVIGACCGLVSYDEASILLREVRKGCQRPLLMLPDAGLAQLVNGETVYPATAEQIAIAVPGWIDAGARIVGGCCGPSLKHIRAISAVVKKS